MRTRATRDGDHYVLNGTKTFVTNAPVADLFVAYATVNPALGAMGITGVHRRARHAGLIDQPQARQDGTAHVADGRSGLRGLPHPGRRSGSVAKAAACAVFECSMEWERGCILASCLGVMRRQLEDCIEHARTRKQFGKPIGKFQSVANRLVDMKVRLDTCRPLVYRIGALKDAKQRRDHRGGRSPSSTSRSASSSRASTPCRCSAATAT